MPPPEKSVPPRGRVGLNQFSAEQWIAAALLELNRAERAAGEQNLRASQLLSVRAAGMALNGALRRRPRPDWGTSYAEHLQALKHDTEAPELVRQAAERLLKPPGDKGVFQLRTPAKDAELLEAARTVMAHAYALVHGSTGRAEAEPAADE